MNAKVCAALVAAVLVFLFAAGCMGEAEPSPDAKPHYIVGIDGDYPPFSYIEADGSAAGFDVESIRWIGEEMGFDVTIQPMAWDGIVTSLVTKRIDMVYSGMTITPERQERVSFTKPYWIVNQAVAARSDSTMTIDDVLAGEVVLGAQRGSTAADYIKTNLVDTGILSQGDFKEYASFPLAVADLENERVDAVMFDVPVVNEFVVEKDLRKVGIVETNEEYGVAVRKEDTELLEILNEGIDRLQASPKWDELKVTYGLE
ncbi:ABC transporter substrate-binding protein [Methanocalculus chunghsingensis]|uniref:ABC transporter substrate-binding protein n=1 Tax=Methanocalculus chunghsingensis TaxID=156457 RepID=A0A8J8B7I4_9EURY|nr:ABC transporter substrate-binding protein [Methanocalculus chunghsingensis]MBR1369702.1 ABC transporter substrate-binding protein [Methanocalculus chunghsingensis]